MPDPVNTGVPSPEAAAAQQAHDAKMIEAAKGVQINGQPADAGVHQQAASKTDDQKPQRPEWCPEKFWNAETGQVNAEALAKSYGELERGRQKPEGEQKPNEGEKPEGEQKPNEGDPTNGKAPAELIDKATAEFSSNRELTPETVAELEKVGYSRGQIDVYVAGLRAEVTRVETEIYTAAGGEQGWKQASAWAAENYTDAELEALNEALGGSSAERTQAVKGLHARFRASGTYEPATTVQGANNGAPTGDYFKSQAELTAAMADAKYRTDSAYRDQVAQKLDRALKAGVKLFA